MFLFERAPNNALDQLSGQGPFFFPLALAAGSWICRLSASAIVNATPPIDRWPLFGGFPLAVPNRLRVLGTRFQRLIRRGCHPETGARISSQGSSILLLLNPRPTLSLPTNIHEHFTSAGTTSH